MKYPVTVTSVRLFEQTDEQLRDLAHQSVKVAEPKKVRYAFKVAIAIAIVSIVGAVVAGIIITYRKRKNEALELTNFNRLKELRDMQIAHHVTEPVNIEWNGNGRPKMVFAPDTNLLVHAKRAHPEYDHFDMLELRELNSRRIG